MAGKFMHKVALMVAMAAMLMASGTAVAQAPPGGGGGGSTTAGGVEIDANGVLSSRALFDGSGALDQQRANAAKQVLSRELQTKTETRWISINRLEAQVAQHIADGQPLPDEIKYLAGLTRISHVFFFPESKDIVIGGPAEGFFVNGQNRVVGTETGSATLHLEDLIVALRAFGPDGKRTGLISCSIDPTTEGLARMQQTYANVARSNWTPADAPQITRMFAESLGLQTVTVKGVSPKTRLAHILVDADYHMKLIGIGLEEPPVRITSFIKKATATTVAKSSLQRWFFQPEYSCLKISEDRLGMELVGGGVKLAGEDESVARNGNRKNTGKMNRASRTFCDSFTKNYDKLAEVAPLYAELRNVMDMCIVAAFIQSMDYYQKAEWEMSTFGDESKYRVETHSAPRHVQPAINAVWKGRHLMTPIGGGVVIQPAKALKSDSIAKDTEGKITEVKSSVSLEGLTKGQWWWD